MVRISRESGRGSFQIELIDTMDTLAEFAPQWEQFFVETPQASPYFAYEWLVSDFLSGVRSRSALRICTVRDGQGLLAILPFARRWQGPLRTPVLRLMAGSWTTRLTAIVSERARGRSLLEEVLSWFRERDLWLYCHMRLLPAGSPLMPPDNQTADGRFAIQRRPLGGAILIDLPGNWEEYLSGLSKKFQKNLVYEMRTLQRQHRLRMSRVGLDPRQDAAALERALDDAVSVSRRSWQGSATWGVAISDPDTHPIFRDLSLKMASRGRLELSILYADDEPISFIWGAAHWPATSVAKLGFDQAWRKYSPGNVHFAMWLQDSIARGGKQVDFGHEFPDYKLKWSRRTEPLYELWFYPRTAASSLVQWWRRRSLEVTAA